MNIEEKTYLQYFGKNYNYYKNQADNVIKKWNWASFFLGSFWLIYRNLYNFLIVYTIYDLLTFIAMYQLKLYGMDKNVLIIIVNAILAFIVQLLLGRYGNQLCLRNFYKKQHLNSKPFTNRWFRIKKGLIIFIYCIVIIGTKLGFEYVQKKSLSKTIFTINKTDMFFTNPIVESTDDGSTIIIYKEYVGDRNDNSNLVLIKRKNGKILYKHILDSIKAIEFPGSQFVKVKDSGEYLLLINTDDNLTKYHISRDGEVINQSNYSNNNLRSFNIQNSSLELRYIEDNIIRLIKIDVLKNSEKITESVYDANYFHIEKTSFYYRKQMVKDYVQQLTIYKEDDTEFFQFNINTQKDHTIKKAIVIGDNFYFLSSQNIYIIDTVTKEMNKINLGSFEVQFIGDINSERIDLWGISNTFWGEKLTRYQYHYNGISDKRIFYKVKLNFINTIVGKYDEESVIISGISNFTDIFTIKVSNKNELLRNW